MTRLYDNTTAMIVACSLALGFIFGVLAMRILPEYTPARTPYENCIAAANLSDENGGFATEVCEPLDPRILRGDKKGGGGE